MKKNLMNFLLIGIISSLITVFFGFNEYISINKIFFSIEIESTDPVTNQLFFDVGNGFNENDSSKMRINRSSFTKYSYPIGELPIKAIRFDPSSSKATLNLKNAKLESKSGVELKNFPITSFKAVQQVELINNDHSDLITVLVPEKSYDPIIEIENSDFSGIDFEEFLSRNILKYIKYFLLLLLVIYIFNEYTYTNNFKIAINSFEFKAKKFPLQTIFIMGFLSSILSCYPVIFFNKSFLSPQDAAALYSQPPWIPGFTSDSMGENFRGSDMGATAWQFSPYSVVQHQSIFKLLEFPFWDRYVGGGNPLFAQGQSLIGDILHLIPVLLEGSALGWDIKFVIAKCFFSIGMGILVFFLTKDLLAGVLIAISSCFIGFYAYRFNHAAFFALTYAPWIVIQWYKFGRNMSYQKTPTKIIMLNGSLLVFLTWSQLNSGALKESLITLCFMQALGIMVFWEQTKQISDKVRKFAFIIGVNLCIVLILAPHWLLFLDALNKSFSLYDNPGVQTYQITEIIRFFDNYFTQAKYNGISEPSVNLFVFFCMVATLIRFRAKQILLLNFCWALFILAIATAYGLIPSLILLNIPLINKIQTIGNSFSMPMIILALLISGYGINFYILATSKNKKNIMNISILIFILLSLIYASSGHGWTRPTIYFLSVIFIGIIGFSQLHKYLILESISKKCILLLILCFVFLHIRHGMHLKTGIFVVDQYIMNPNERGDYLKKSEAIEFVKKLISNNGEPTRVIGEGYTLFPGFNTRYGVEGLVPVDALRNQYFEKLMQILDYPDVGWGWLRLIRSDQIASRSSALDMLGVGFILSNVGVSMPENMTLVNTSDLDVWKRNTVWPRAFFTNHIYEIQEPKDILNILKMNPQKPFAAVESQYKPNTHLNINNPNVVTPARNYVLTNNNTNFSIYASDSGIIVLCETYYPGDFQVTLNGKKVEYIRVNEAYKGVWVEKGGSYDVSFRYIPEKLDLAIKIFILGCSILFALIVWFKSKTRIENSIGNTKIKFN